MRDMSGAVRKICDVQTFPGGFAKRDSILDAAKDNPKRRPRTSLTDSSPATASRWGLPPRDSNGRTLPLPPRLISNPNPGFFVSGSKE